MTYQLHENQVKLSASITLAESKELETATQIQLLNSTGQAVATSTVEMIASEVGASPIARLAELQLIDGQESLLAALLYSSARRARIEGAKRLELADGIEPAVLDMLHSSPVASGSPHERLDINLNRLAQRLNDQGTPVPASLMVAETREMVLRWLEPGQNWSFFRKVLDGDLTQGQYIYALENIHQFVRHTTRILGRCIAHSEDSDSRRHFINHLNGEVNHELIVEKDLEHLGVDPSYVRLRMPPNQETLEFMAVQESAIGFHEDPLLLVASPLAAEGVTAHMTDAFMNKLIDCARGWGITQPEKACQFFSSHMTFDGGMDGHWEATLVYLERVLNNESQFQRFLVTCRASMASTQRMYDSFCRDVH